jgi:antibiotic biosynthesis monooxygenase (ABM) superfamily enzyme
MPIQMAITRRVRPGCEAKFQDALRDFLHNSFAHGGVQGASMIVPSPGSDGREFGILRTFANEAERDAFYASPLFKEWDEHAKTLTEGEPQYRELHGLEAWFRSLGRPPECWKMAMATVIGVYPTSLVLSLTIGNFMQGWPLAVSSLVMAVSMVAVLTWVAMPLVTRLLRGWIG